MGYTGRNCDQCSIAYYGDGTHAHLVVTKGLLHLVELEQPVIVSTMSNCMELILNDTTDSGST